MPMHRGSLPCQAAQEVQAQGWQQRMPACARLGSARLVPHMPQEKLPRVGFKPAGFWPESALALLQNHRALPQPCPALPTLVALARAAKWHLPPGAQQGLPRCCLHSRQREGLL